MQSSYCSLSLILFHFPPIQSVSKILHLLNWYLNDWVNLSRKDIAGFVHGFKNEDSMRDIEGLSSFWINKYFNLLEM